MTVPRDLADTAGRDDVDPRLLAGTVDVDLPDGDPWSARLLCDIADVAPPTTVAVALPPPVIATLLEQLRQTQQAQYAALGHPAPDDDLDEHSETQHDGGGGGPRRPLRRRLGDPLDVAAATGRLSPAVLIAALLALTIVVLAVRGLF